MVSLGFAHVVFKGPMGHPSRLAGLKLKGEVWAGQRVGDFQHRDGS